MLVFLKAGLVYLAVPKTGSVAVEMATKRHANIDFRLAQRHIPARRYRHKVAPFVKSCFGVQPETLAVIRDPVDHLRSWYKFRSREGIAVAEKSASGTSFDEFVEAFLTETLPVWALVNNQHWFLTGANGQLLVDHLFAYDQMPVLQDFLQKRLDSKITFDKKNVSPSIPTPLDPAREARLRERLAPDIALYQDVVAANGHLCRP